LSNSSYRDYDSRYRGPVRGLTSRDDAERERAESDRRARIAAARSDIDEGRVRKVAARDTREVYDPAAVKKRITKPSAAAKRLHVVLIDNSGSNRRIADHLKASSGYLLSIFGIIDPDAEIAWIYFSDHCDGAGLMQEIDYVKPDEGGDKVVHSTISAFQMASGGDAPEAIECALWRACEIDFGSVPKKDRYLYLVTDEVAHGMGRDRDEGCPDQRDWRDSVKRVGETYGGFTVVGCTTDKTVAKLQAKFLAPSRLEHDLVDLSAIEDHHHRLAITGNALLFLVARNRGDQTVKTFLMMLYEKWLSEPIFGANTDLSAREGVRRFLKYLEIGKAEREQFENSIFV